MAGIVQMKDNVRFFLWTGAAVQAADKLGNLVSIGEVGGEAESIDTTTLESMAKESEVGFTDNGTIPLVQNLTANEYNKMRSLMDDGTVFNFGMSVWDRKTKSQVIGLQQKGIVTSLKLSEASVGSLMQVKTTITISGAINVGFTDPIGYEAVKVTKITLSGTNTIDTDGGTTKITAEIQPPEATNKTVTFSLVGDGVTYASLTPPISGTQVTVTGVADGKATLQATANDGSGVVGTIEITVSNQT